MELLRSGDKAPAADKPSSPETKKAATEENEVPKTASDKAQPFLRKNILRFFFAVSSVPNQNRSSMVYAEHFNELFKEVIFSKFCRPT